MLITNVVDIYELNIGVIAHPKERSISYNWKVIDRNKGLDLTTRNVLGIMTVMVIIQII